MQTLSPLELRVLRAVQDNPRHGAEPLARVAGETVIVVRSTLGRLRRFGLVSREPLALIGYATYSITDSGAETLRDWARRDVVEQLPPGVIPIVRGHVERQRRRSVPHVR
jgi:hypothetical protein